MGAGDLAVTMPAAACRRGLALAALVAVTGGTAPAWASSATESPACEGVQVLVEARGQDIDSQSVCVTEVTPDSTAADLFAEAGYDLTWVQRFPGAVCQVDGVPVDEACVAMPPGDAYWGLFWSDGVSGEWVYASTAATSLSVPEGGSVAFVWQDSATRTEPEGDPTGGEGAAAGSPSEAETGGDGTESDSVAAWLVAILLLALAALAVVASRLRRGAAGP